MHFKTWLKQLFPRHATKKAMNEVRANKELSIRARGYRLCEELDRCLDRRFDAQIAGLVQFKCIRPNIVSFIELLKELNASLRNEDVLNVQRCYFVDELTSMSSFFQKDGYYIAHTKIQDYRKVIEEFYVLTEACEKAEFGPLEHNFRMLTKVFESLKDVNLALLEVLNHQD